MVQSLKLPRNEVSLPQTESTQRSVRAGRFDKAIERARGRAGGERSARADDLRRLHVLEVEFARLLSRLSQETWAGHIQQARTKGQRVRVNKLAAVVGGQPPTENYPHFRSESLASNCCPPPRSKDRGGGMHAAGAYLLWRHHGDHGNSGARACARERGMYGAAAAERCTEWRSPQFMMNFPPGRLAQLQSKEEPSVLHGVKVAPQLATAGGQRGARRGTRRGEDGAVAGRGVLRGRLLV